MREKLQTPAQRVTNPVWLRDQIGKFVQDCDANVTEDQQLADKERDDRRRAIYLERVESHQHWKHQLERVLRGKTLVEESAVALARKGVSL